VDDDLDGVAAPNCPLDLIPMETSSLAWVCPECGLVRMSA